MPGGWSQEWTFGLGHEQLVASYGKIRGKAFKIKGTGREKLRSRKNTSIVRE